MLLNLFQKMRWLRSILSYCPFLFLPLDIFSFNSTEREDSLSKQPRYIPIGSSISAGVQNFKHSNLGIKYSFPIHIANQIGIKDFSLPLYQDELESLSIVDSLANKDNFLSNFFDKSYETPRSRKIKKSDVNFTVPFLKVSQIAVNKDEPGASLDGFDRRSYSYLEDIAPEHLSYLSLLQNRLSGVDFFTYELGFDDFVSYYLNGGVRQPIQSVTGEREGYFPENIVLNILRKSGAKGVVMTIPDPLFLPYFRAYPYRDIVKKIGEEIYIEASEGYSTSRMSSQDYLLPSANSHHLFSSVSKYGKSIEFPIKDNEVISNDEIVSVQTYNSYIKRIAKENGYPVLDLYDLYKRIINLEYISNDGVFIDPSYPQGNFFSKDGIFPSPIGQVVIANEVIKVLNIYYNLNIPLVNLNNK